MPTQGNNVDTQEEDVSDQEALLSGTGDGDAKQTNELDLLAPWPALRSSPTCGPFWLPIVFAVAADVFWVVGNICGNAAHNEIKQTKLTDAEDSAAGPIRRKNLFTILFDVLVGLAAAFIAIMIILRHPLWNFYSDRTRSGRSSLAGGNLALVIVGVSACCYMFGAAIHHSSSFGEAEVLWPLPVYGLLHACFLAIDMRKVSSGAVASGSDTGKGLYGLCGFGFFVNMVVLLIWLMQHLYQIVPVEAVWARSVVMWALLGSVLVVGVTASIPLK